LPILLLLHGQGCSNKMASLNGYGPLARFWAAHGFVVIQPTHLCSKTSMLNADTPGHATHMVSSSTWITWCRDFLIGRLPPAIAPFPQPEVRPVDISNTENNLV
jgi:predicted dienelactone hydrolase